jgi:hypothetical protein
VKNLLIRIEIEGLRVDIDELSLIDIRPKVVAEKIQSLFKITDR